MALFRRNFLAPILLALSHCCLVLTRQAHGLATTPTRRNRRTSRSPPGHRRRGEGFSADVDTDLAKAAAATTATTPSSSSSWSTGTSTRTATKESSSKLPPPQPRRGSSSSIYSLPALYDLAFGYRDYAGEVDFLVSQHRLLQPDGRPPRRVLELAAGPARHCIEALRADASHGVEAATALDNSPEMMAYAKDVAAGELLQNAPTKSDGNAAFSYVQADMADFSLDGDDGAAPFDSAWILLGSLQHLTTNGQVIDCLRCVHRALRPDGTLIIELPHPRETFSLVECTRNGWEVPVEDEDGNASGELSIVWGDDNDDFDPIRQVRQFTVAMELKTTSNEGVHSAIQSVKEVVPLRLFTAQEIDALGRISGFRVASMHGSLANGVDVNDDDEAYRLVCVLQRQHDS
jgi:SAM-dependent methyltransferase